MRSVKPGEPESAEMRAGDTAEERLLRENQELKRQLQELKGSGSGATHGGRPTQVWHPSALTIWTISLAVLIVLVVAFLAGYIPLYKQRTLIAGEALGREQALPRVEVIQVTRASGQSKLELPGSIQAITEAPILSRASGYIKRRMADIGDHVKAGQPLAEIDSPELDQQVLEAKANLQQAHAQLDEALANLDQGKSNLELARATAQRWSQLVGRGVVSRQENDQYQTQYQSQLAGVKTLERAIAAQRSSVAATEANLARLQEMQGYEVVRAPFDGIITLRNVDTGALVSAANTLLFRIAQTGTLRTYVNVPQANASQIKPGQPARLTVSNLPGRHFTGLVARTANALDPSSRTMLVEVHVPNGDGALLPGMYAQVDLSSSRADPPLLIPSDALMARPDGNMVAIVRPDHTVHLQKVDTGRDYGDRLEILDGLSDGDTLIPNPGDLAREGLRVDPVSSDPKTSDEQVSPGSGK